MPPPYPYPLPIMQGPRRGSSGRKPHSQSFYPHPRFSFLLHKRQAWHNCVSEPLWTRDNCPSVCMATQPRICLLETQGWSICVYGLAQHPHIFFSFLFQMSPKETQVLGPMVLLKPEHHSWGQHLPHAHTTHHQPPSSFLRDPPEPPSPSHSAPETSQDNCERDGRVPQVRGGVSMKEGPEALVGGPPLSPSVVPALSAFRLRLPGRDTTPAPLEDMLSSHSVHWYLNTPICPVKVFLQQFSLLGIFSMVAPLRGGGLWLETREGEGREGGTQGGPLQSTLQPCSASRICDPVPIGWSSPTFPRALRAERGCRF